MTQSRSGLSEMPIRSLRMKKMEMKTSRGIELTNRVLRAYLMTQDKTVDEICSFLTT